MTTMVAPSAMSAPMACARESMLAVQGLHAKMARALHHEPARWWETVMIIIPAPLTRVQATYATTPQLPQAPRAMTEILVRSMTNV